MNSGEGTLLPPRKRTLSVPADRRAQTYEREEDVDSLLRYGTHFIHGLPRGRKVTTIIGTEPGTAADHRIVLPGEYVSADHCQVQRRSSGLVVTNLSKNGICYDTECGFGHSLRPNFEDLRAPANGVVIKPGMTFLIDGTRHRFVGLDRAMREHHPTLLEILGSEDEVRDSPELGVTASPSDLILAAASAGHLLITGKPGCEQEQLARIVHEMSKRREKAPLELTQVPDDVAERGALLKRAARRTIILHLKNDEDRIDPTFVGSMFSADYNIRVIVVARSVAIASKALGAQHVPLMHVWLRHLSLRRAAIHRLLDQWLVAEQVPLRVADLTPENQRALASCEWRENLSALRETAVRLAALARAPKFERATAADDLGVVRTTFYAWYKATIGLSDPLVPEARQRELTAALADRTRAAKK